MIAPNAVPIAHLPPLPRIDLGARPMGNPNVVAPVIGVEALIEHERIWQLVRQASGAAE